MDKHGSDIDIKDWPDSWLRLEIATILSNFLYLTMTDHEKRLNQLPVTREEMVAMIEAAQEQVRKHGHGKTGYTTDEDPA